MHDRDLLKAYVKGDTEAFGRWVERHESALLRYVRSIVRDNHAAEDVAQDAFLKAVAASGQLLAVENHRAWLFKVARNLALDHKRRNTAMQTALQRKCDTVKPHAMPATDQGDAESLLRALQPREREVLHLKIVEGQSYRDIAELTGLSVSNVGFIIHNSLKKLAHALDHSVSAQPRSRYEPAR